ncbi:MULTISPECIES: D-serine ammonia-lyase [unclassified Fusibacter]|uniref:D-serine ammonia-lyase n=1 Tax=unclassified Fusibacter TaxID=2624464 RepID=UPI001012C23E|nr:MULTISPECIES: D-serine ammonia-lyase [unclassified Fusibacter]MCK8061582.1 D-serine ammonia-lyase [Fusibacter sp. A2]NPE23765.1 D-serine ammonia-lyase [Fusibacter sp. A1]RXV58671.1 D-serine ammonia-lyase [Fusibacter sp. A1]
MTPNIIELIKEHEVLQEVVEARQVFWINPKLKSTSEVMDHLEISIDDVYDASERLDRFASYFKAAFPQTTASGGIIESKLEEVANFKSEVERHYQQDIPGNLYIKLDSHLPIAGSIKARGGIYEVIKHAEALALSSGRLKLTDSYEVLNSSEMHEFFSQYSIAVGSTGNLGLSIGIVSAKLGFNVFVHMSSDAKAWKKEMLRSKGVTVVEYDSDYSVAVEKGRKQSENDPDMHFVDDENSKDLFMGYAVAALRLKEQLKERDIIVDSDHPLFVYLPCGVGGGPGGVAFGLKCIFGDDVHCYFVEPVQSPCMLIGMETGLHDKVCVQEFGLSNSTQADGLAVGRASGFVGHVMQGLLEGIYTIDDDELFILLKMMADTEQIWLEPSALAGMKGPVLVTERKLATENSTHIMWATGGGMVPEDVMKNYYEKGI